MSVAFPVNSDKSTSLELDGVTYVQLTGPGTDDVMVPDSVNVSCDIGLRTVNGPDLTPPLSLDEIDQCVSVSAEGEFSFSTYDSPGDSVVFIGPGILYYGPGSVLFVDDSASTISDSVESSSDRFVPIIPPLSVEVVNRSGRLVLNVDTDENDVPSSANDVLFLTRSSCTALGSGQSVSYSSNTLRVRQGIQILSEVDDVAALYVVLDQNIAGIQCRSFDIDEGSRDLSNSLNVGFLCTGSSAINPGDTVAFYTNSTSTVAFVSDNIINTLILCGNTTEGEIGLIAGPVPPTVNGDTLVHLSRVDTEVYPGADEIQHLDDNGNNIARVTDRFGNILRTYTCLDGDVSFSLFHMFDLVIAGPGSAAAGTFVPRAGGLSVLFNLDDCALFAYPTILTDITNLIATCSAMLPTVTETSVSFSSVTTSLGVTTFSINGMEALTTSSSMSFAVGSSQSVTYQDGTIRVIDTSSGSSVTVDTIGGVGSFVANTGETSVMSFTGSAPNRFIGAGTLYVDGSGRAFYTTSETVSSFITDSTSTISRTVDIVPTTTTTTTTGGGGETITTTTTTATLSTGGSSFFTIPSSESAYTLSSMEQVVVYMDRVVLVGSGQMVPSDTTFQYFDVGDGVIQITRVVSDTGDTEVVSSLFNVTGLTIFNGVSLEQVFAGDSTVISGGGILYRGENGAVIYLPSSLVREFVTLNDLGVFTQTFENIDSCAYYDGDLVQVLTNRSLEALLSPGLLLVDVEAGTCFYTADTSLITRIPTEVARILPSTTQYSSSTGFITVTSNSGTTISRFPLRSRVVQFPEGEITYVNGMITSSSIGDNLIGTGVTSIVYFDGYQQVTADTDSDELVLPGGGLLVIDPDSGMAFYTTSTDVSNTITTTISNAALTLIGPDIEEPVVVDTISKLNTVEAIFGEVLTVYEGADVRLTCNAGNANPPAVIGFSTRSNLTNGFPFTAVMNTNVTMIIDNDVNSVTLVVVDIELTEDGEAVEYRCEASNDADTQFSSTLITVRPRGGCVLYVCVYTVTDEC